MTDTVSMRDIRRRLRELPRERRTEITTSIREGRAVRDPRDAALAADWAERMIAIAGRSPSWLLPLARRPHGWRARVWLIHLIWLLAALIYVYYRLWYGLSGTWRWVLVGFLAYTALTIPLTFRTMRRTLRGYWNAPEAVEKNRNLAETGGG